GGVRCTQVRGSRIDKVDPRVLYLSPYSSSLAVGLGGRRSRRAGSGASRQVTRRRTNHLAATASQKGRHPCPVSSESTSAPPTPPSPSSRAASPPSSRMRSEEHTSELQSRFDLVCRLLLEKK